MHLLEACVEVNVIRGWFGHVSLTTASRYADIDIRTKEAALGARTAGRCRRAEGACAGMAP